MTSFNHYALGAVADWMHRVVGGIAPLEPGYSKVLVAPQPGGGLTEAETALENPRGRIAVHWAVSGDQLTVDVDLPDGIEGVLRLPGQDDRPIEGGHASVTVPLPEPAGASR
jgi:alpha-L-rhamnosidase